VNVDVTQVQIAAGLAGTVTTSALVMILLQNVKAMVPNLQGEGAEVAGGLASLVAVTAAMGLARDTNWYDWTTYVLLFISWMSLWVGARSTYALLFKQSVPGLPPTEGEMVTSVTKRDTDMATTVVTPDVRRTPEPQRRRKAPIIVNMEDAE
jgi:hypothetical protein